MTRHKSAAWLVLFGLLCFSCDKGAGDTDTGPLICTEDDLFTTEQCPDNYPEFECTVYVDGEVESSGDGWSWDSPVKTVQEGIDLAHCGATIAGICAQWEVWVKQGEYFIHKGCREHTVRLRERVALLGGFDGEETESYQRDWEENKTTLNGRDAPDSNNRVYHVMMGSDDATIDGLTITGGKADAAEELSDNACGAGMFNVNTSPTLANCVFEGNHATGWGGGVLLDGSSGSGASVIDNCVFRDNSAKWGGALSVIGHLVTVTNTLFADNFSTYCGGAVDVASGEVYLENCELLENVAAHTGGGVVMHDNTRLTMVDCIVTGNRSMQSSGGVYGQAAEIHIEGCVLTENDADWSGGAVGVAHNTYLNVDDSVISNNTSGYRAGGISVWFSDAAISGVTFDNNSAQIGGAVFAETGEVTLVNSVFTGNTAVFEGDTWETYEEGAGGAVYSAGSTTRLVNSTLVGNTADVAGDGLYSTPFEDLESGIEYTEDDTRIVNSIIYGNGLEEVSYHKISPLVTYSDVAGGFVGEGNIDADPLFVNPSGGDLHLQAASPCIGAASPKQAPKTDMDGNPRGGEPDMGAYEY